MTTPGRRSWGSPSPKKRRNILIAVFRVEAMNRWGMLSEREKRRSVRPNLPLGEKKNQPAGWERFARTGFMAKDAKSMDGAAP